MAWYDIIHVYKGTLCLWLCQEGNQQTRNQWMIYNNDHKRSWTRIDEKRVQCLLCDFNDWAGCIVQWEWLPDLWLGIRLLIRRSIAYLREYQDYLITCFLDIGTWSIEYLQLSKYLHTYVSSRMVTHPVWYNSCSGWDFRPRTLLSMVSKKTMATGCLPISLSLLLSHKTIKMHLNYPPCMYPSKYWNESSPKSICLFSVSKRTFTITAVYNMSCIVSE